MLRLCRITPATTAFKQHAHFGRTLHRRLAAFAKAGNWPHPMTICNPGKVAAHSIRLYDHGKDHCQIVTMCANVYGGQDYLPRQLKHIHQRGCCNVFVAEDSAGTVDGIVCSEVRADILWVFGVRVREEARGHGVATRLLAHLEQFAREIKDVVGLLTSTIGPNLAMRKILGDHLGYTMQQTLDAWPRAHDARSEAVAASRAAGRTISMLEHVEGAREALFTPAALAMVDQWQVCTSVSELQDIVMSAKRMMLADPSQASSGSGGVCWVPFEYAPYSVATPGMGDAVESGRVWVVRQRQEVGEDHTNPDSLGILVLRPTEEGSDAYMIAGITATTDAVLESALIKASSEEPHFSAWVERPSAMMPSLYSKAAARAALLLVYFKNLVS